MNKHLLSGIAATTFVASLAFAAPASAAVTFDANSGTGFVGKGDVQLAFGWSNSQLQGNATGVTFAAVSTTVTEVSWVCTNEKNESTQERERTTTSELSGVVSAVTRDGKKQVTGFNLTGYAPNSTTQTTTTEGPKLNSCPASNTLTTHAGDPVELSSSSVLKASYNGVAKDL